MRIQIYLECKGKLIELTQQRVQSLFGSFLFLAKIGNPYAGL